MKEEEKKEEEKKEEENIISKQNNIILKPKNNIILEPKNNNISVKKYKNYSKSEKRGTNFKIKNFINNSGNLENFINNLGLGELLKKKIVEYFKTLSNLLEKYKKNEDELAKFLAITLNFSSEDIKTLFTKLENLKKRLQKKTNEIIDKTLENENITNDILNNIKKIKTIK